MKLRLLDAASATALAVALLIGSPVLSQTQLRQSVANQLEEHNIAVANFDQLSEAQVAQIELVLNTTDSESQKRAMVDRLLAEQVECEGNAQLRQQVANQLKEHNIRIENFDNVTGTQLVVVKTVLDGTESNASKAAQIERIFAYKRPVAGGEYLRRDAAECIRQVGADIDVNDLTPDEMLQIQLIVGSDDDVGTKKARIEALAND